MFRAAKATPKIPIQRNAAITRNSMGGKNTALTASMGTAANTKRNKPAAVNEPQIDVGTVAGREFSFFRSFGSTRHKSINNRRGSSSASFTRTRNVTAPLPSTIR